MKELCGTVIRVDGQACIVQHDHLDYRAFIPKRIQAHAVGEAKPIVVGDQVRFAIWDNMEMWVQEIFPRSSWLARGSVGKVRKQQIVVANVEQLCVISSIVIPPFRQGIIDRILVAADQGKLKPILVINKLDLLPKERKWAKIEPALVGYRELGYPVVLCSVVSGEGIPELREKLQGKMTAFVGHSGVGKSSLLSAIDSSLQLKTQEVSRKTKWGKHTTTSAVWLPLTNGGVVVDTPGIREFALWELKPEELIGYFPELARHAHVCKYKTCTHVHEPDCAVKLALATDKILNLRYQSYCRILASFAQEYRENDEEM